MLQTFADCCYWQGFQRALRLAFPILQRDPLLGGSEKQVSSFGNLHFFRVDGLNSPMELVTGKFTMALTVVNACTGK